jgi:hypothetical protein
VLRPSPKRVVAAGVSRGRAAAVTFDVNTKAAELVVLGKRGGVASRRDIGVLPDVEPAGLGELVFGPDTGQLVCVIDGRLLRLEHPIGFAQSVEAITVRDIMLYIGNHPETGVRGVWGITRGGLVVSRGASFAASKGRAAVFGWHPERLVIAVEEDGWLVSSKPMFPGSGTTVFGAVINGSEPSLLLVEDDRRTVSIVGRHSSGTVCRSRADIAHASASSYGPFVAWVTVDGELTVRSLPTGEVLLTHREVGT